MRVQKYMNNQLLKSFETSAAVEIENQGTVVTKDEPIESDETQIEAKIVKIDIKTLVANFLYQICSTGRY